MDQITQFIQRVPKLLLGTIIIVGTLFFLIYNDPPKTVCDIQMEVVNKNLVGKFYTNKGSGKVNAEGQLIGGSALGSYQKGVGSAFDFCMKTNSAGGCYDMFSRLYYLEKQTKTIPKECGDHSSTTSIRDAVRKGIKLLVTIAWGETPPETAYEKVSWLDTSDIALFCKLQAQHQRLYGASWKQFRESVIMSLPEAKKLTRKERWEKSLFSYPCRQLL